MLKIKYQIGKKIGQILILLYHPQIVFEVTDNLSQSRGDGGFGSSNN